MKTCKDCGEKFEKLTRQGICKQCYNRKANMKYHKKEYIPIKDLSEEERMSILNRRKGTKRINNNTNTKDCDDSQQALINKIAKGNKKLYQEILTLLNIDEEKIREEVDKDIEQELKRRNISLSVNTYNLDEAFRIVYESLCEKSYLTDYLDAEMALTDFVNDFQHRTENTKLEDLREFVINAIREQQALNRRRPYKNKCLQLDCTKDIREYAKTHPEFMELFNNTRIALAQEVEKQENPIYQAKASGIILNQGNVLPQKRGVRQRYDVWVPCYGLYGNKNREIFRLHGGTLADSPEKAKENLRKTIAKMSNVTYKDIDIQVALWDDNNQVKEGA